MSDVSDPPKVINLTDSNFYAMCRSKDIFSHLVPDLPILIATEQEMLESNPREPGDTKKRIFIHYTNKKGNSIFFKLDDEEGVDRKFDIDDFIAGYALAIEEDLKVIGGDKVVKAQFTIMSALSYSLGIVTKLEKDNSRGRILRICTDFLTSSLTCLYDQYLDVMILCRDGKERDDGEKQITITNMWSMSKA